MKSLFIKITILIVITNIISPIFANGKDLFEAYLPKGSSQVVGHTWNERKVTKENCRVVLELLNKYSSSFKQCTQDIRYSSKGGPMMQLAPSAFLGFTHNGNMFRLELYSFSNENKAIQVVFELEKEQYFVSREFELISGIEKIIELK